MDGRVVMVAALLLAGCSGKEVEPLDEQPHSPVEEGPRLLYYNDTAGHSGFMGLDGTLFLTSGPGPATVSERIYTLSHRGELQEGAVAVAWSSTSAPTIGMALWLSQDGQELARVEGTGALELDLPPGALSGAHLHIAPVGPAGAHLLVKWEMGLTSQWLV